MHWRAAGFLDDWLLAVPIFAIVSKVMVHEEAL
jgi:hypothetical protein